MLKNRLTIIFAIVIMVFFLVLPSVSATENITVINENFGKVKIQGKVQSNGSVAFAVRSSFGESETQDIIQYFIRDTNQDNTSGMELNPAFDFNPSQNLIQKTDATVFQSKTISGGDERAPVEMKGFGWIGATHGTACAVTVTSASHGVEYSAIGNIYKDPANVEWVLLRVSDENKLVFVSKDLQSGDYTMPTFYSTMGSTLTNIKDSEDVIKVDSYKNSRQLRPAYKMTKQNVYIVSGKNKTLVEADQTIHEGDYVLVEEEYTIKNPVYVAQAIIDNKPVGGYTENPNLAVGKDLVTFRLQQIYNPDGTVIHNWDNTFHQDVTMSQFGGIQWGTKATHIYLPNTKAFSATAYDESKIDIGTKTMDFSNIASASVYPSMNLSTTGWADSGYVPHRRLDFTMDSSTNKYTKLFVGGYLPVFDGINETRVARVDKAYYMNSSRKAYFHFISSKTNTAVPDLTNFNFKGSAYKKYVAEYDEDGTASYYSVPYFSDGDNSRYMYFDLYKPGTTKKYDISAYIGKYTVTELEKTENLNYEVDETTGILTISASDNGQTSADTLVLKLTVPDISVMEVKTEQLQNNIRRVTVKISNKAKHKDKPYVVIAVSDDEKSPIIKSFKTSGNETEETQSFDIENIAENTQMKILIWKDLCSIKPISAD